MQVSGRTHPVHFKPKQKKKKKRYQLKEGWAGSVTSLKVLRNGKNSCPCRESKAVSPQASHYTN